MEELMISLLARTKGSDRSVEGNCVQIVRSVFLPFQVTSHIRVSQELLNGFYILSGVISLETPSCASARRFSG
jgi:hypothetical protein